MCWPDTHGSVFAGQYSWISIRGSSICGSVFADQYSRISIRGSRTTSSSIDKRVIPQPLQSILQQSRPATPPNPYDRRLPHQTPLPPREALAAGVREVPHATASPATGFGAVGTHITVDRADRQLCTHEQNLALARKKRRPSPRPRPSYLPAAQPPRILRNHPSPIRRTPHWTIPALNGPSRPDSEETRLPNAVLAVDLASACGSQP